MRYNVNSRFMVCADYDSYIACQAQVEQVYMVSLKVLRCTALTVAWNFSNYYVSFTFFYPKVFRIRKSGSEWPWWILPVLESLVPIEQ